MFKRIVVIASVLATTVAAVTAFVSLASGAAADPTTLKTAEPSPPAGAPLAPVLNRTPQSTADYWNEDRRAAATPKDQIRDGVSSQSYGSANLDFTRSQITPTFVNRYAPYKGVGKLYFTEPGVGDFQCSASIIAKRLIVTAGHCMYGNGGFYTNWQFIPGFDGAQTTLSLQRPYGTWNWAAATVPANYASSSSTVVNDYDFGIIQMADQSFNGGVPITLRTKVGFNFTTAVGHLFDTAVSMLGYPCNFDSCNIMQRVDSSDHRGSGVPGGTNGDTAYEYGSDMTGGSSGGPWVENFGSPTGAAPTGGFNVRNAVVAVTSYGYTDPNVRIQGASQFNSDFTSIKNLMCGFTAGNC